MLIKSSVITKRSFQVHNAIPVIGGAISFLLSGRAILSVPVIQILIHFKILDPFGCIVNSIVVRGFSFQEKALCEHIDFLSDLQINRNISYILKLISPGNGLTPDIGIALVFVGAAKCAIRIENRISK